MPHSGAKHRADEDVRQEAIAWLARLRGADGNADHKAFEDWYAADPRHADIYDDVLTNWDAMAAAGKTPAAHGRRKKARSATSRVMGWGAVAAAIAGALLLIPGSPLSLSGPAGSGHTTQLVSQVGEIRTMDLPDGSQVTLDTDSRLAILYSDDERRLRLDSGRARFRVAHGDPRAFLVEAGTTEVIAHGTVFDVAVSGPRVAVALIEGSVEVRQPAPDALPKALSATTLSPGQRLLVAEGSKPQPLKSEELRWASGMLSFSDTQVGEVAEAANRYSSVKILIADQEVAQLRFTGTFDPRKPDAFALSLASMFGLTVTPTGDGSLLLSRSPPAKIIPG